jgi:hypothetical protein
MNKQEKEDARKRIVNFYNDAAGGNLEKTVNFFFKTRDEKKYHILYDTKV